MGILLISGFFFTNWKARSFTNSVCFCFTWFQHKWKSNNWLLIDGNSKSAAQLRELGMAVCVKLASCPGPNSENAFIDHSTGVLCGGLKLLMVSLKPTMEIIVSIKVHGLVKSLRRPVGSGSWKVLVARTRLLLDRVNLWWILSSPLASGSPPICCAKVSRQIAFDVISAAAQACSGCTG